MFWSCCYASVLLRRSLNRIAGSYIMWAGLSAAVPSLPNPCAARLNFLYFLVDVQVHPELIVAVVTAILNDYHHQQQIIAVAVAIVMAVIIAISYHHHLNHYHLHRGLLTSDVSPPPPLSDLPHSLRPLARCSRTLSKL